MYSIEYFVNMKDLGEIVFAVLLAIMVLSFSIYVSTMLLGIYEWLYSRIRKRFKHY